jgi:hypothetical protein
MNTIPAKRVLRVVIQLNYIRRKKKGVLEPIARMSNINSVIRCKTNECKLCCLDRGINASKNILGLLLNQYRGEERPICFKPKKLALYLARVISDQRRAIRHNNLVKSQGCCNTSFIYSIILIK